MRCQPRNCDPDPSRNARRRGRHGRYRCRSTRTSGAVPAPVLAASPRRRKVQATFFDQLLEKNDTHILVAADNHHVVGFVIARLEPPPPVCDPGGPACTIDDFGADNVTTARELLVGVRRWAAKRGATQLVVIAAHGDRATRTVLEDEGMTLASEWWVQPLQ